jgi:hypothetical protein
MAVLYLLLGGSEPFEARKLAPQEPPAHTEGDDL